MGVTLSLTVAQLKRVFRDPITLIVLFSIPALLLVLFGAFTSNTNNLSLKVAVVNSSDHELAKQFSQSIKGVDVFKETDKTYTLDEAKQKMKENNLDGIIELPKDFGAVVNGKPSGKANVFVDPSDRTNNEILTSILEQVSSETNKAILGVTFPISLQTVGIEGTEPKVFDGLYSMFTGMAIMMVGIFGVASSIPADKKIGVLRRLRATPLKAGQFILAHILTFAVVGVLAIVLMTALALLLFDLEMKGDWFSFGIFTTISLVMMLGLGLAIGGWAKNSTQADIYGQIAFISSMAFSGLWVPRALLPEWLQNISAFLPLTAVIEGIQSIVIGGASLIAITTELTIIAVWAVVMFVIGIKTFRWE